MRIPSGAWCRFPVAALLASLALAAPGLLPAADTPDAAAPGQRYPPLPQGSIRGTLVRVDAKLNGLIIRDEATNKQMAWKIDPSVVVELAKFKPGDPLWVIYRETGGGNRSITAIGFPGTAPKPEYRNATGSAIHLVSGPYVNGACRGMREPSELHGRRMARGTSAEDDAPCWCCAAAGEECAPANRAWEPGDKVTGTIVLSRCFAGR